MPSAVSSPVSTNAGKPSPKPSFFPSPGDSTSPVPPSTFPTPDDSPSPVPSDTSCDSATDNSSDQSSQSAFQVVRQPKLLYNHYVSPGDGWTFLCLSDPSGDSLDVPLPSPSSIPIDHLKVPPSCDVLGSQDQFGFLDPVASAADDECSSSYVSPMPIDADSFSLSTVQNADTNSEQLN